MSCLPQDGASAVEAALKIALQYWHNQGESGRTRFISLQGGHHGDTLGTIGVGYVDSSHRPFRIGTDASAIRRRPSARDASSPPAVHAIA